MAFISSHMCLFDPQRLREILLPHPTCDSKQCQEVAEREVVFRLWVQRAAFIPKRNQSVNVTFFCKGIPVKLPLHLLDLIPGCLRIEAVVCLLWILRAETIKASAH